MYVIRDVPARAAESMEQLGTKYKFWYVDPLYGSTLFKEGRPGTGENWAEKIACELAQLLGLPHAHYELARFDGRAGVISPSLVARGARLIHGNELLVTFVTGYGTNESKVYRQREHTIRRLLSYFKASAETVGAPYGFEQSPEIQTALDVFIGYLMFDAWIANQDRHDLNWALLRTSDGNTFLSPSYDHGSSLGRNEPDAKRSIMLTTKDMGQHITRYVLGARSALYPHVIEGKPKALLTLDAYRYAARHSKVAGEAWRAKLAGISDAMVRSVISQVPSELMSNVAKEFTERLLQLNKARILECSFED